MCWTSFLLVFLLWVCSPVKGHRRPTPKEISAICGKPVGIADGSILDTRLTALSVYKKDFSNYGAHRARLHLQKWPPGYRADPNNTNSSWIKVDLGKHWVLTGIAVQGYGDEAAREWVTDFMLMTSSGSDYSTIRGLDNKKKVFKGNRDSNTVKFNAIPIPVIATSITLYPLKWHNNIGLRMELYGCKPGYHIQAIVSPLRFPFVKSYLDPQSPDYVNLAADIQTEISFLLRDIPGYLSANIIRFNPWEMETKSYLQTEAEVNIQCIINTTKYLETMLQYKIQTDKVFLNPNHLLFHHPLDKSDKCSSPAVKLDLGKNVSDVTRVLTTNHLDINADIKMKCKVFRKTKLRWEVSALYGSSKTFSRLSHLASNEKSITLKPHQFPPALMYIRLVASTEKIEVSSFDYGLVQIERPPLVANVTGPMRVVKGQGIIILDGSKSFDPDPSGNPKDGVITYTWFCKREDDFTHAQYSARRRARIRYRYQYKNQFMRSIPADIPHGRPFSDDGCFGYGPGRMSSTSAKLRVNVNRMKSKNKYIFKLTVSKGRRHTTVYFSFRLEPAVQFSVRCARNCVSGLKTSQSKKIFLTTRCVGKACKTISNYKWKAYRELQSSVNGSIWEMAKDGDFHIEGIRHHDSLIITNLRVIGDKKTRNQRLKIRAVIKLTINNSEIEEEAELKLVLNSPPHPGSNRTGCVLTPKSGKAMITVFAITCGKWYDEDGPVTFEFRYKRSDNIVVIGIGASPNATVRLPLGVQKDNYSIPVQVRVYDRIGDFTIVSLHAKMDVYNLSDFQDIVHKIVDKKVNDFTTLVKNNESQAANELAIALLSMVNVPDEDGKDNNQNETLREKLGITKDTARKLKDEIINQIVENKVDNWQQATQVLTVINLATGQSDETSDNVKKKTLEMLNSAKNFIIKEIEKDYTLSELKKSVTTTFISTIGNLLRSFVSAMRYFHNMNHAQMSDMLKSKKNTQQALKDLRELGDSLLSTKGQDEKPSIFNTKSISMILSKNSPSMLKELSGSPIQSEGREVKFPSLGPIFDNANISALTSVQSKIIMFTNNPFQWDKTSTFINSWVVDINLYNDKGKYLDISGLSRPVGVFVPEDSKVQKLQTQPAFVKPSENSSDISNIRYHHFNILNNHATALIQIKPSDGKQFEVFVSAGIRPLPWDYNYTVIIPDFSTCQKTYINGSESHVNCTSDPYTFNVSSRITGRTGSHFIGIRYLQSQKQSRSNDDTHHRTRRGCGKGRRTKRSCVGVKDAPTIPVPTVVVIPEFNASSDANYTMSISLASCLYWSDRMQKWTDYGCKPGPDTVKGSIHCLCNHLSSFGGDFFIEPNPIDFDKVLLALKNPKIEDFVVTMTVIIIFMIYLIGLLFARRADRKDEHKVIPNVYLTDQGSYLYKISVLTGVWKGNGTTANVGMILYGENGYTDAINLNDSGIEKTFFARGSINSFLLYLPKGLGPIYKIKIWHDNFGLSPAWFLREVVVSDAKEELQWNFLVNKWIALEKGDGEIEIEVKAADKKEIQGFRNVFHSRASQSLADSHLWASVFMRLPQTTFTRVQRMSCCLSIIFATMVTNAMFYQFGETAQNTFQVGPLKISWMQIKIGIQSGLVAIPVNAVIVTIFRYARPKEAGQDDYASVSDDNIEQSTKRKGFPHFFVYVGWLLCIATSVGSAVVTILYSLSWGGDTANEWLTSILVSFVQDIFFTQPIKVIILASLLALLLKKPPSPETARGSPHWKSKLKDKSCLPPKGQELEEARYARKKLFKTARVFAEIVTYFAFAILLFIICYGNRKTSRFYMNDELKHVLRGFDKVGNRTAFWQWVDQRLVPGLYNTTWYNGRPFEYEEGFVSNREAYLVGMPRLRQLRVKAGPCPIADRHPDLTYHIERCIPPYSPDDEDVTQYHTFDWSPVTNISVFKSSFELSAICPRPWRYQDAKALNALSYRGMYSSYNGGGYVADLGYTNRSATKVINTLKNKQWIDNRTAAVFIEFTVFEPASLLISAVKTVFEMLPTGGIRPRIRVEPLTVYGASDPDFRTLYQTCQLFFIAIVTFLFACECFKIYKKGCPYFFKFWSWMDLVMMTSALCAMATLFFKEKYVSDFIRGVHSNPFKTTTTDFIVLWSHLEIYLLSFVIFIMTIKFLRLLRFNRHIGHLMLTLKRSTGNLKSFYVVLFVVLIAFTQAGMLLFGRNMDSYSTFIGSMSIVLQKLLGTSMQLRKVQRVNKIIGPIFVFAYSLTVALLLLNVFLSILNTSYKEVRESGRRRAADIALRKYINDYMRRFCKEVVKEIKDLGQKMRITGVETSEGSQPRLCNDINREHKRLPNGTLDLPLKSHMEMNELRQASIVAEQYPVDEKLIEFVEKPKMLRYVVPLASFDEEDDILDELACLEDIKASFKLIERDLIRATCVDDESSDEEVQIDEEDKKSEECFRVGSQLSVTLSVFETERPPPDRLDKDDLSLYSVYCSEEGGVSDEDDEETDLFTAFHGGKSGMSTSFTSINEICANAEQQQANPELLSPLHPLLDPHSLRW